MTIVATVQITPVLAPKAAPDAERPNLRFSRRNLLLAGSAAAAAPAVGGQMVQLAAAQTRAATFRVSERSRAQERARGRWRWNRC